MSANPTLLSRIDAIAAKCGIESAAVAVHDYENGERFSRRGAEFFHAASTIKVALLLAVFRAAEAGRIRLEDPLHVRNRFISKGDGGVFKLDAARDAEPEIYRHVGRTMTIGALTRAMIVASSNFATNLLFDFLGADFIEQVLRESGIEGVRCVRGVEDHAAFERGINNEVTAEGLLELFRVIYEGREFGDASRREMIEI